MRGRVDPREERPKEKRKLFILSWPLGKKIGFDFILRRKESKLPFVKATRKLSFCVFFLFFCSLDFKSIFKYCNHDVVVS